MEIIEKLFILCTILMIFYSDLNLKYKLATLLLKTEKSQGLINLTVID